MKPFINWGAAAPIFVFTVLFLLLACTDKGGIDPPKPPTPEAPTLTVSAGAASLTYDGFSFDSTRTLTWTTTGTVTGVTLNGVPVSASGTLQTGALKRDTTFRMIATGPLGTTEQTITIKVTYDPMVLKLCTQNGWKKTKTEAQYNATGPWQLFPVTSCEADDRIFLLPNRSEWNNFGTVLCGGPQTGRHDVAWGFTSPAKTAISWGQTWTIIELLPHSMVLQTTQTEANGDVIYLRRTYVPW